MRKAIPSIVRKKITQESNSICPFCGEDDVSTAEIHHIKPISEGGESTAENLIYLCSNCHSKVTRGQITESEIKRVKNLLSKGRHPYINKDNAKNVIRVDFTKGVNKGIIANQVEKIEIRTTKSPIKVSPPSSSIASSVAHRNYIKHLIDRYHDFKKIEVGAENMRYPIFYNQLKKRFGAKWDMVPLGNFEELSTYIKGKIDKTKHGRIQKARGDKNYSDFNEYLEKYGGYSDT